MIFVTAGAQLPFERLGLLALCCARALPDENIFYQAGPGGNVYFNKMMLPDNLHVEEFMAPQHYQQVLQSARCVITHAGMGNLLHLLEQEVPFLVLPRLMQYGEHRNNHQLDTARAMHEQFGIHFYCDSEDLLSRLLSQPLMSDSRRYRNDMLGRRRNFAKALQNILVALDR